MFEILGVVFSLVSAVGLLSIAAVALGGSAVGLAIGTPLFVIFSPVLLPAGIAASLLAMTLAAAGGSGISGLQILIKIIKKVIEKVKEAQSKVTPGTTTAVSADAASPSASSP